MRRDTIGAAYEAHHEKVRFLLVGVWNSVFAYLLFAVLLRAAEPLLQPLSSSPIPGGPWMGEHYYLIVQWVSWILGVPQSTLAFKFLVFRSKGHWAGEVGRSYLVYAPLQLLSFGILWLCAGLLGLHPLVGQLVAMTANAILSYFGHRRFTFRQQATPDQEPSPEPPRTA